MLKEVPDPGGYTDEFYHTLKTEISPVLHKLSYKVEEKVTHLENIPQKKYSFSKDNINFILSPNKDIKDKVNYSQISPMNTDTKITYKTLTNQKILINQIQPKFFDYMNTLTHTHTHKHTHVFIPYPGMKS